MQVELMETLLYYFLGVGIIFLWYAMEALTGMGRYGKNKG